VNTDYFIFLSVVCFIGMFFGWFFRKGIRIWGIIAIGIFSPVLVVIMELDIWPITIAFCAGFLIHTWKPIYRKLQKL